METLEFFWTIITTVTKQMEIGNSEQHRMGQQGNSGLARAQYERPSIVKQVVLDDLNRT